MKQRPPAETNEKAPTAPRPPVGRLLVRALTTGVLVFVAEFAVMCVLPLFGLEGISENIADSVKLAALCIAEL
ncbi:MAG: hypothetical protein ACE5EC_07240, partial [Phycisphaerae bacterium]